MRQNQSARKRKTPNRIQDVMRAAAATQDRARWLLDFVNRDLRSASAEELDAMRWEARVFAYLPTFSPRESGPTLKKGALFAGRLRENTAEAYPSFEDVDPAPAVKWVHKNLLACLYSLLTSGSFELPFPVLDGVHRLESGQIVFVTRGNDVRSFLASAFEVLKDLGPRLRKCQRPGCRRFFAAVRQQTYCSRTCNQRVRTARFEARHRDKIRQRKRQDYEKRVKAQPGRENVKIARRPR